MNICILVTSRNNYQLLDKYWAPNICAMNKSGYPILNIDEDSSDEEKLLGKKVCEKHGIQYLDREERGMANNLVTAAKTFPDAKFIVWFQSDCWPIQDTFFQDFDQLVANGKLDDFAIVGFNGLGINILHEHYERMRKDALNGKIPIGVVGRSPLEVGDMWYCGVGSRRIKYPLKDHEKFKKPFSVSIAAWFAAAVNVKKMCQCMDAETSSKYFPWFHSWDDICCQFLAKNIHNITLPHLYVDHRPDLKPDVGVPERAVRLGKKGIETFHPQSGISDKTWQKVWGFSYDKRESFAKVEKRYKGTLLQRFYNHNPQNGPLETFDSWV